MYVHIHILVCMPVYVCDVPVSACICWYVHICTCQGMCAYVCMYEYTCEWEHCVTHMCVHIQAYLYLSVDVRVYVPLCVYGFVSMYYM